MRFWSTIGVLLLLACVVNAETNTDDEYGDLLDFSREDAPRHVEGDYSDEHNENELGHKYPPHLQEVSSLLVCAPNKADRCECEKKTGRIDCRKDTREKNGKHIDVEPLQSAAIRVKLDGFVPKYVYLTGNQIASISNITLMKEMQDTVYALDLSFNDIEFVGEYAFDGFKNLTKLRLNQNWIRINDNTDGWLTEKLGETLKILNLGYNSITALNDEAFDSLHNLDKLILDGNTGLVLSSGTFGKNGLQNLTTLSLDECGLKTLPDGVFNNLPKLKYLSLINNEFMSIPAALKLVPTLQTLDLSENKKIDKWEPREMSGFPKLLKLFLRKMEIQVYVNCAFCGLTSLEHIDVSNSSLTSFDPNAFGIVKNKKEAPVNLKTINMENCHLTTLDKVMLNWDKLENFAIGGNKWHCDYNMDWLIENKELHLFIGTQIPKCASPSSRAGIPIQKVADQASNSSFGSFFRTIFYLGIGIGVIGIALTGVMLMSNRYNTRQIISNLFTRQQPSGAGGFSNLNADIAMEEDERVFDDDDDNEFRPRPAAV